MNAFGMIVHEAATTAVKLIQRSIRHELGGDAAVEFLQTGLRAMPRILLVEDELLIAMLLEETLQDAGYVVVGPYARLAEALRAIDTELMDAAVLDVELAGEKVYPAAELLAQRGVPFLLLSGHGPKALPADRQHWRHLSKPFNQGNLLASLAGIIQAAA